MKFIFLFLISCFFCSCTQIQNTADAILKPSAREVYAREFKDKMILEQWQKAFEASKTDSLSITLPYVEQGKFNPEKIFVYSYDVFLERGEVLNVVAEKSVDSAMIFIDVFKKDLNLKPLKTSEKDTSELNLEIEESSFYKIIVQPSIYSSEPFTIKIYTEPSYQFPVAGSGNQSIQSFWGANRDGGNRSHEGVDIFAKRGTPIVAATEGRVGFTGERGLGGKQVWLSDGLLGNSIYYAHLDSIFVSSGQKVNRGDTLGTVGNTGNAKNSPPHLHFGIYQRIGGAIDPLHFIKQKTIPKSGSSFEIINGMVLKNKSELRLGAATTYPKITFLNKEDSVFILGKSEKWYHVSVGDSLKGFIHQSLVK